MSKGLINLKGVKTDFKTPKPRLDPNDPVLLATLYASVKTEQYAPESVSGMPHIANTPLDNFHAPVITALETPVLQTQPIKPVIQPAENTMQQNNESPSKPLVKSINPTVASTRKKASEAMTSTKYVIAERHKQILREQAFLTHRSESEMVREALDDWMEKNKLSVMSTEQ